MLDFRLLADIRCSVGESPVWDERRQVLFFVDIKASAVHSVRLDGTGLRTWPMPETVGSIGLGESGRLVVALKRSIAVLDPESGKLAVHAELSDEPASNRLNDGKVGPDGAFWVGSMDDRPQKEPVGSLYRVDAKGHVTQVVRNGCLVSNGLAWSTDGRIMYHSDSRGPWVDRYDFEPTTGRLRKGTRIASLDEATGRPDGAACDDEGFYWSAGVSAGCLNRFSQGGTLVASYPTPIPAPTMPCFCGDDLRMMAITSLRPEDQALLASSPQSGSLFTAQSPVAGAKVGRWADT